MVKRMSLAIRLGLWSTVVLVVMVMNDVASGHAVMHQAPVDEKLLREEFEKSLELRVGKVDDSKLFAPSRCKCVERTCNCCQHIKISQIGVDTNCCINVMDLEGKIGIKVTGTFGNRTIFSQEISVRDPPPICVGLPFWAKGAGVCVRFYNLELSLHSVVGCGEFNVTLLGATVFKLDLGCFSMKFVDHANALGTAMEQSFVEAYTPVKTDQLSYYAEDSVVKTKELEQQLETNQISKEEIRELLRNVQLLFEESSDSVAIDPNGCKCDGVNCSCCQRIGIREIGLDQNCCVAVSLLKEKVGVIVAVTIGKQTLYSKEISVREQRKICIGLPGFKKGASVCLQFYDLKIDGKSFSGCGKLLFRLLGIKIATAKIGCFNLNFLDQPSATGSDLEEPEVNDYKSYEAIELPYFEEDRVGQLKDLEQQLVAGKI